jgi:predicted GNAT family N-acyltransferase
MKDVIKSLITMNDCSLLKRLPTVDELKTLHTAVGWNNIDDKGVATALKNSLFGVVVTNNGKTIGCGRVIGDGAMYFYIQDIIVVLEFQGKGLGKLIMDAIMEFVASHALPHTFVGLMAAKDKAGFYVKYGFKERATDSPGMYIWWK